MGLDARFRGHHSDGRLLAGLPAETSRLCQKPGCHPRESGSPECSRGLLPSEPLAASSDGGYGLDARFRGHDSDSLLLAGLVARDIQP